MTAEQQALADQLVLRLQGGGPDRVVVVDPRSGAVVAPSSSRSRRRAPMPFISIGRKTTMSCRG